MKENETQRLIRQMVERTNLWCADQDKRNERIKQEEEIAQHLASEKIIKEKAKKILQGA